PGFSDPVEEAMVHLGDAFTELRYGDEQEVSAETLEALRRFSRSVLRAAAREAEIGPAEVRVIDESIGVPPKSLGAVDTEQRVPALTPEQIRRVTPQPQPTVSEPDALRARARDEVTSRALEGEGQGAI